MRRKKKSRSSLLGEAAERLITEYQEFKAEQLRRERLAHAIETQNKLKKKAGKWDGVSEVRRWRELQKWGKYVIDTSVVVKWFSENKNETENAVQLRQQMLDGFCFIAMPDLLIYELANALKHNPNLTMKEVKAALDSVLIGILI